MSDTTDRREKVLRIPELALVALVGPTGSGKSTFARRHFRPTEIISSDTCRGWVSDDETSQDATADAFDVLYYLAAKRLKRGKLTVVDATHVRPEDRKRLIELARAHHVLPAAIVFDLAPEVCHARNEERPDRDFGMHVVAGHSRTLRRGLGRLGKEGFRNIQILRSPEEVDAVTIERVRLWNDKRDEHGPFDIIGDVHGCNEELVELLGALGYAVGGSPEAPEVTPPNGRRAVFVGDLVDRGPGVPAVLRLVMSMVRAGAALCVPGNHEVKLLRKLRGKNVRMTHGLQETMDQLVEEPASFSEEVAAFIDGLISHYVLDGGRLVVAHAGLKEELQGRASGRVREFCLFGETTGETDEFGLPVRFDWATEYRGAAHVVYGHTPVPEPVWVNRTVCVDTGCVYGGKLTALRYPEKEFVQVAAKRQYVEPVKPIEPREATAEARPHRDLLDIGDVLGKRVVQTRFHHPVTVRDENAAAALEVMSRFAVDPRWLVYLPPTMAPSGTCAEGPLLERPSETFGYFAKQKVARVVCQEKHMGSRAVVLLCRDRETAKARFGATEGDGERGVVLSRTGRRFFNDPAVEAALLDRLDAAMAKSGLWDRLESRWVCLDAELMPWSAKAQALLQTQYAPTGLAGTLGLSASIEALSQTQAREEGPAGASELLERTRRRLGRVERFVDSYRRYCWATDGLNELKLAPFHLLASEGRVFADRDHLWHMETLRALAEADPELLVATAHRVVDLGDERSIADATAWWSRLTEEGGEGMVVKPLDFITRGPRGLVQPALKCRGREYLRLIYGPEYTTDEDLERLRGRRLGAKRALALQEFALGLEALQRFVEGEPLYRVHECVFGVLALESETTDPRL